MATGMVTVVIMLIGGHRLDYQCALADARALIDGYAKACDHPNVTGAWRFAQVDGDEYTVRARDVVALELRR